MPLIIKKQRTRLDLEMGSCPRIHYNFVRACARDRRTNSTVRMISARSASSSRCVVHRGSPFLTKSTK